MAFLDEDDDHHTFVPKDNTLTRADVVEIVREELRKQAEERAAMLRGDPRYGPTLNDGHWHKKKGGGRAKRRRTN